MKRTCAFVLLTAFVIPLAGCMAGLGARNGESWTPVEKVPELPERLEKDENAGMPLLSVYDTASDTIEEMDVETYVMGVVAGEMKNDWPMEALKAQAILARTFVMKFCKEKHSEYEGADISTDVTEAQAYSSADVNDHVREAVQATRGQVMAYDGDFPNAWFHAHAGGMTELPSVALDYQEADPDYLKPVESMESDKAPEDARRWTAKFKASEVRKACADAGLRVDSIDSIQVGEKGASGRAATLVVNGDSVSAPSFRIQIGTNKLRSTLIDSITLNDDTVIFKGRGFGHGVGMSQWGAYELAEQGKDAESIIRKYFKGIDIVKLW